MKKLLSILSLGVLLFCSLAPSFTYANNDVEVLEGLLQNAIDEEDAKLNNNLLNNNLEQNNEDQVTLLGNTDENPYIVYDENNGLITVYSKDYSYGITLQDKNYGASNIGGYGTAYNWGNNTNTPTTSIIIEDNNAWGGGSDVASLWGYDSTTHKARNVEGRKGICPDNYHIPSIGEWSELINLYYQSKGLENNLTSSNYLKKNNQDTEKLFLTDLKLPLGGVNCNSSFDVGSKGYYRSSSKQSNDNTFNARYLEITNAGVVDSTKSYGRACKMSIRCFKNDYIQKTFTIRFVEKDTNNLLTGEITAIAGKKISENLLPIVPEGTIYDYYEGNEKINNIKTYTVNSDTTIEVGFKCKPRYVKNDELNRCIRRPEGDTVTVIYHPNGGAFSGMEINQTTGIIYDFDGDDVIPIYNIQIPDRKALVDEGWSGWMFAGWYTKSGESNDWGEEFDPYMLNASIAYAKWLPFNDLDLREIGLTGVKIMDRNLGAEAIATGTYGIVETNAIGYYYQWGNNYGFKNSGNLTHSGTAYVSNPNHDKSPWGPGNYYYSNKFIKNNNSWDYENNKNLWGGENEMASDNDKKGPCPEGYHVPNSREWRIIYEVFEKERITDDIICSNFGNNYGSCFANKLKLPFGGYRVNRKTTINGVTYEQGDAAGQGTSALYWTSSPYFSYAFSLGLNKYSVIPQGRSYKAQANPVRCIKNTPNKNTLTFIDNGEIIKQKEFGQLETVASDEKPKDPKRENNIFEGWYISGSNEKFNFSITTFLKEDTILIPKFSCDTGYIETEDGKSCEKIRLEFETASGVFKDGRKKIVIYPSINSNLKIITKISHTPNLTDEGDFIGFDYVDNISNYTSNNKVYYQPSYVESINIDGAEELNINLRYGGNFCGGSSVAGKYVWTGDHLLFNEANYNSSIISITSTSNNDTDEINRSVSGNSITIFKDANCPDYGRYATITGVVNNKELEYSESSLNNITEPILTGYNFIGWYIDEGNVFDSGNLSTTEITKIYAKWKPHHYTIKFDINGGTGNIEEIIAIYGEEISLPNITREGYTFKGWQSEDGILYNKTIPEGTGITTEDGVIIILTAQWDIIPPSAGGGKTVTPTKQETEITEQEHNSADLEKIEVEEVKSNQTTNTPTIQEKIRNVSNKSLTRGEVAVMTNILLDVYPQLTEKRTLNEVSEACENFADEQNFTKDEKKAITRLCKLSIMGIHNDTNEPLEEFLVNNKSTNDEFSKVINRSVATYNEKDLSTIKEALKKLEGDEENVVFGTVYDVFMSIKNIFN